MVGRGKLVFRPNNPCPECGGTHIIKSGFKMRRSGKAQRWQCQDCGRTWLGG